MWQYSKQRAQFRRPCAPPLMPGKVGETTGKLARFDIDKPTAA